MPTMDYYTAAVEDPKDVEGAYAFCRGLARAAGRPEDLWAPRLASRSQRRHLDVLTAFLRLAEAGHAPADSPRRREFLEGWRRQLRELERETPRHPVLLALSATLRDLSLPREPFDVLLGAFLQDCETRRFSTSEELRDFCARSAEPVGRLALMIQGVREPETLALSDRLCSALRLTRWLRDLSVDLRRDRVYFSNEDFHESGCSEADLRMGVVNERFRSLMKGQWRRARALFEEGRPLAQRLAWPLSWEVRLSWLSGIEILRKIEKVGFDTTRTRPAVEPRDWPRLVTRAVRWRRQ